MSDVNKGLSREEAQRQLEALKQAFPDLKVGRKRIIKINAGGGLYVTDPCMKGTSKAGKEAIKGINFHDLDAARAMFNNQEFVDEIRRFLNGVK